MEKFEITLTFDREKYQALEFCLKKEKATVKGRLDEALAQLYEQTVPQPLREYLDSRAGPPPRPRRPPKADIPKGAVVPAAQVKEDEYHGQ